MSGTKFKLAVLTPLFALAAFGLPAHAEDKPKSKKEKVDHLGANPEDGPRVAIKIDNAMRLRQMIDQKIKLTQEQAGAINRIFDDYVDDLRNNYKRRKTDMRGRPDNKVLPPTVAQMQRERDSAAAIGDQNRVDELDAEMSLRRREPLVPGDNHGDSLRAKLIPHLKDDQVAQLDKVIERWNLIIPKGPRTGPFQRFRRALKDPEVGIPKEKDQEFDAILQEALKAARTGKEGSRERIAAEVENAKGKIFAQLSPEQRRKVEANIRLFEEIEKQYDDSIDRGKAKGPFKKKDAPKPAQGSTLSPGAQPADVKPVETPKPAPATP